MKYLALILVLFGCSKKTFLTEEQRFYLYMVCVENKVREYKASGQRTKNTDEAQKIVDEFSDDCGGKEWTEGK